MEGVQLVEVDILSKPEAEPELPPDNKLVFISQETEHVVKENLLFLLPFDEALEQEVRKQIEHFWPAYKDYNMTLKISVKLTKNDPKDI